MNEIGTLSEKSVHSYLKNLLEPDCSKHEVQVGKYIADIKRDNEIIEIQTQQFENLLNKLNYYIQNNYKVTVVYPLIHIKTIKWIDKSSMEIVEQRKSSHKGVIQDIFSELYWIIEYIAKEQIEFKIMLVDVDEYKYLDGRGHNQKIKATKIDKVPTNIVKEISFCNVNDLKKFIPDTLPKTWTSKEFKKESHTNSKYYNSGLKMLRELNVIHIVEKRGNSFVYELTKTVDKTDKVCYNK